MTTPELIDAPSALPSTCREVKHTPKREQPAAIGEPVWSLAESLYPRQGEWTIDQYHDLLDQDEDLRVEFADGCLEFLPVPTRFHEDISNRLFMLLYMLLGDGNVYRGGYELVTRTGRGRFPDVLASRTSDGFGPKRGTAADLVIEIVSPGSVQRQRDFADKRADYAATGVGEYWIVDPEAKTLTQLRLDDESYVEVGVFAAGQTVTCESIPGFVVAMDELMDGAPE